MVQLEPIPKPGWKPFFEVMSHALLGRRAEIEVASLDIGDQIVAEWVPLIGITYDSNDDLLDVALDGTDHLIRHPRDILIERGDTGIAGVAVVDEEGTRQIIRFKEPVMLPPPGATA